ncbi:MAG: hypothetical protein HY730_08805 [Candidatus Tectomicrobia bacterium]|uniref:Uncharacterized protein n=1 Tax=Tectimicrobiota bacterium TaxID=2528274 RepID=A0A933LQR7_UNCTE|nr:hypothetical protein [Candidatus Tectomicrobia bacterium]
MELRISPKKDIGRLFHWAAGVEQFGPGKAIQVQKSAPADKALRNPLHELKHLRARQKIVPGDALPIYPVFEMAQQGGRILNLVNDERRRILVQ